MKRYRNSEEHKVLLDLLKGNPPSSLRGVDTALLFDLLQRHRLLAISLPLKSLIPEKDKGKWMEAVRRGSLKSLHQTSELARILEGFNGAGIEAIPIKGPVLAQSLYGNIGDRQFIDLDVYVRGEELSNVLKAAGGMGYRLRYPEEGFSDRQWKYYFTYKKDVWLVNPVNRVSLEIHMGLENRHLLHPDLEKRLMGSKRMESIGPASYPAMIPENCFLYLAIHGALHQYSRLFWLRDFGTALNVWELDHPRILENAMEMGVQRLLGVSLILARELMGVDIPEPYKELLDKEKKVFKRMVDRCEKRIFGPDKENLVAKLNRHAYFLLFKPGIGFRWFVIKSIVHRWYIARYLKEK